MKIPINWLKNYIKLEHTPEELGNIMTQLEFMQDGPITKVNGQDVINLEIRQNRPDMLSIIGVAREYGAYADKPVNYPEQIEETETIWGNPEANLAVLSKDIVKRFCTVEISNIKIKKSPEWLIESLEAYGIPAINNLVDTTNYVMLEYGMPLHTFDYRKLAKKEGQAVLTLRQANTKEQFTTWQKTNIELSSKDLVVADSKKAVAIAGIIGGANSDISKETTHIILEGAVYDHASIRKTSYRHSLRTEASTRHEKFLNPEMVEIAIKRALLLIQNLCEGKIIKIEDYYENKQDPVMVDFDINEITRLSGVQFDPKLAAGLLKRLNFEVLEQKEAIGVNKNIFTVRVPAFRTDVKLEADLVEDVLRLWGYQNIPLDPIGSAPPDYSTSSSIQLEEKLKDILAKLGLSEHITSPIVKYVDDGLHIKLENPLNENMDSLRVSIKETLKQAVMQNIKYGSERTAVFEAGKVYKVSKGRYQEEKRIEAVYRGLDMLARIKPDLESVFKQLGIKRKALATAAKINRLEYSLNKKVIAILYRNGFEIYTDNLAGILSIQMIQELPYISPITQIPQIIKEDITIVLTEKEQAENITNIAEFIREESDYIQDVYTTSIFKGTEPASSVTLTLIFKDKQKELTRDKINKIKKDLKSKMKSKFSVVFKE